MDKLNQTHQEMNFRNDYKSLKIDNNKIFINKGRNELVGLHYLTI